MKLPKSKGCLFPFDGGNVKKQTMIVEGQGIGFWTRVRLPSGPRIKHENFAFSCFFIALCDGIFFE